jgi:hypothetical protein
LVSTTYWVALVPTPWGTNAREAGETAAGGRPPVKARVCGLVLSLSLMFIVAVRMPAAPGVKVTEIVQVELCI